MLGVVIVGVVVVVFPLLLTVVVVTLDVGVGVDTFNVPSEVPACEECSTSDPLA